MCCGSLPRIQPRGIYLWQRWVFWWIQLSLFWRILFRHAPSQAFRAFPLQQASPVRVPCVWDLPCSGSHRASCQLCLCSICATTQVAALLSQLSFSLHLWAASLPFLPQVSSHCPSWASLSFHLMACLQSWGRYRGCRTSVGGLSPQESLKSWRFYSLRCTRPQARRRAAWTRHQKAGQASTMTKMRSSPCQKAECSG